MMQLEKIKQLAAAHKNYMVALRRDLHAHPELAWQEVYSRDLICSELDKMNIPYEVVEQTGVIARLGPQAGPRVGLRADMDALPIQEEGEKAYASKTQGMMHACGHDGHMALMLGTAKILKEMPLQSGVSLIFQPAEENMTGAARLAALPQLQEVANYAAVHVWSTLPVGDISVEAGPRMARADLFEMTVEGQAAHGSMPHLGVDALYIASLLVNALQAVVSRETDPRDAAVLTIATMQAGTGPNILAGQAKLAGTLRSFSNQTGDFLARRMQEVLHHITRAFGAKGEFSLTQGVPPVINDEKSAEVATLCAAAAVGESHVVPMPQTTGGEDFAYFLQKAPGVLAFVGAQNPALGADKPHHHCEFDIDEDCLVHAAAFLAGYAVQMGEKLQKGG